MSAGLTHGHSGECSATAHLRTPHQISMLARIHADWPHTHLSTFYVTVHFWRHSEQPFSPLLREIYSPRTSSRHSKTRYRSGAFYAPLGWATQYISASEEPKPPCTVPTILTLTPRSRTLVCLTPSLTTTYARRRTGVDGRRLLSLWLGVAVAYAFCFETRCNALFCFAFLLLSAVLERWEPHGGGMVRRSVHSL